MIFNIIFLMIGFLVFLPVGIPQLFSGRSIDGICNIVIGIMLIMIGLNSTRKRL